MAINPLMMLLSQAASGQTPPIAPPPEQGDEILVTGSKTKGPGMKANLEVDPIPMGNAGMLEEAQDAAKLAPQRKGMFGLKGTFRDVLGALGDAFLIQSGNKAMYRPHREQEKMADAMAGFTQNPQAAMERLAALPGGGDAAIKLNDNYETQQLKKAQAESLGETRRSQIDERDYKRKQDFGNYAARVLAKADTPEKLAAAQRLLQTRAQNLGLDLEELGISKDMTPEEQSVLASGDMTVNQQEALPRRDRQLDISQQNANTAKENATSNRIRANRPPAGRSAPQPTDAAMAAPLIQKMGKVGWKGLSTNEQEQLRSLGRSPDRGRGKTKRQPPALPPGFKMK